MLLYAVPFQLTPNAAPEGQAEPASVPLGGAIGREDIWDDSIIIKKYDASLALIKAEVAKRLAMNTNLGGSEFGK